VYKRPGYRKHKDRFDDIEWIFRSLQSEVPYGGIARLSKLTNITASTLQRWKVKVDTHPTWRPSHQAYSDVKRISTDEQEQRLLTRLMASLLEKGLYYSDADFRFDALRFDQAILLTRVMASFLEKGLYYSDAYFRIDALRFHQTTLLIKVMASFLEKGLYYSDADFRVDALRFHQTTLLTRVTVNLLEKGLHHSDAEFKVDALRFHQTTLLTRLMARFHPGFSKTSCCLMT
jgi:hypothetical protein